MSFREHIERVVNEVPGCANCTLLGFDGIAVDTVERPELLQGISAADATIEYANLLTQMREAAVNLGSGELHDVCIRSERMATVMRPLTDEYLVAVTVTAHGYIGKGRYLLRIIAPRLRAELI